MTSAGGPVLFVVPAVHEPRLGIVPGVAQHLLVDIDLGDSVGVMLFGDRLLGASDQGV